MRRVAPLFATALLVTFAPAARAGLPPYWNSTIPSHVVLVGRGPAGADSASGSAVVVVRDLASNPVPGAVVTFDFSACTDMAPAVDQHDPRLVVNCTTRTVSAVTDANGVAHLTVLGSVVPGAPSAAYSFKIYADGVLLGSPLLAALERDGVPGLAGVDLSQWTADFFGGLQPMRADLDGDGNVTALDLSTWARAFFNGYNTEAIGAVCP